MFEHLLFHYYLSFCVFHIHISPDNIQDRQHENDHIRPPADILVGAKIKQRFDHKYNDQANPVVHQSFGIQQIRRHLDRHIPCCHLHDRYEHADRKRTGINNKHLPDHIGLYRADDIIRNKASDLDT